MIANAKAAFRAIIPVCLLFAVFPVAAWPQPVLVPAEGISPEAGNAVWARFRVGGREYSVLSAGTAAGNTIRDGEKRFLPPAKAGEKLFLVTVRGRRSSLPAELGGTVLIRDGRTALVFISQKGADRLAEQGMEIRVVRPPPRLSRAPPREAPAVAMGWEPGIQTIIDAVTENNVWDMIGNLSGVNAVSVGGSSYTIQTRNTYQTTPIQKATQYCLEYFQRLGLAAAYQTYSEDGVNGRNVFAIQTGIVNPDNIYVICAHLDDEPGGSTAPGADDNASGSSAVLLAASILSSRHFENTIRYVLFTGEEQGLYGSHAYAAAADAAGDNILGALNFDMIAYDSDDDGMGEVYWGSKTASKILADLLVDTNTTYSLGLDPQLYSGPANWSDHASFWSFDYPAVTGIESDGDFNPEYHTVNDTRANCNGDYATAFTKAAVGTTARLAVLVAVPSPTPYLPISAVDSGDYDGDGTDECAVFRPSSRTWLTPGSAGTVFGNAGDLPVPADFDGDGSADLACFRPSSGLWTIRNLTQTVYGASGDVPAPGDYNGDGTASPGLFRPSNQGWYLRDATRAYFGSSSDIPIPGDWSGEGTKNIAVFRSPNAFWAVRGLTRFYYGLASDRPIPGDYDGTGWKAGVFRPSSGLWAVRGLTRYYFGATGDWPVPADYDGDGLDDAGVFRPGDDSWRIRGLTRVSLGASGDLPVTR